jgi:hypothetical protein
MIASNNRDDDRGEGERRRDDALELFVRWRKLAVLRGRRALLRVMLWGDGRATADDVRAAVRLPEEINPKCFGAVPIALAKAGIIECCGMITSCRPEAHARPVKVWRLVDQQAALAWLGSHPNPSQKNEDRIRGRIRDLLGSRVAAGGEA